jgi:hypothetical protein
MEEWKLCFETYEISNQGNIRKKLLNGEYTYIKGSINNCGYKYIQLQRNKKRMNYLIHQEVARLFIGERPNGLVIDHIDTNKLNNDVSNLRYITQKENTFNHKRVYKHIPQDTPNRGFLQQKEYREKNKEIIKQKKKERYEKNKDKILEKQKQNRINIVCSECNIEREVSKSAYNSYKRNVGIENNLCKICNSKKNLLKINKKGD